MVARQTREEPRAAPAAAEKPREAQAVNVAVLAASGVACMRAYHQHGSQVLQHHSSNMLLGFFTPCR
ncbi:hypothetical protein Pmani_021221 [Petrolisthes manimaculis]|uniref:Uncharacterized protein n=1 Tax=Petrolisthes manimaculis TaxID=1843537 RepID=A0AAE1PGQ9_9EUCA|nr:hypothetical protein Pmani_021221 [Petrolisthes manimaculis]